MTFEKFKLVIDQMVNNSKKISTTYDNGIDLIDFTDGYHTIIHHLLEEILHPDGLSWLDWFLYEKDYIHDGIGRSDISAFDREYNPLTNEKTEVEIIKNLEELHEYLTQNNYFKCESLK
jgi:hypothetical protein